jgi:hypothetical protein
MTAAFVIRHTNQIQRNKPTFTGIAQHNIYATEGFHSFGNGRLTLTDYSEFISASILVRLVKPEPHA